LRSLIVSIGNAVNAALGLLDHTQRLLDGLLRPML